MTPRSRGDQRGCGGPKIAGTPVALVNLYLSLGEPEIAKALDDVALSMPDVAMGSYPRFDRGIDYRVKVTVEHVEKARVEAAVDRLTRSLPEGAVIRRHDGNE